MLLLEVGESENNDDGEDCTEEGEDHWATFSDAEDYVNLAVAIFCVCGAAMAAGLTMSMTSLEAVQLRIIKRSGSKEEQRYAGKLLPIVTMSSHHRLLVTLLTCRAVDAGVSRRAAWREETSTDVEHIAG